jgi:hypothetical protein
VSWNIPGQINRKAMEALEVSVWYGAHPVSCPNCGVEWKTLHPAANLIPHWTGACKSTPAEPKERTTP